MRHEPRRAPALAVARCGGAGPGWIASACRTAAGVAVIGACLVALPAAAQSALGSGAAVYAERWAATCATCHGERGTSKLPLVPSLGGQSAFYVATQLFLFRDGRRQDHPMADAMTAVARPMDNNALRGWSDFVASLPPPPRPEPTRAEPLRLQRGKDLAVKHHCLQCHGADLAGGRQVPRIAHQREDYLLLTLKGFRSGQRVGYSGAMAEAVAGLQAQDLEDLAHFLAHAP